MESGHNGGGRATVLSNRPFIVGALFLGTYFVPFLVFIGVALAYYFRRHPEEEWEDTHFVYLIRTFWFALAVPLGVLMLILGTLVIANISGFNIDAENLGGGTAIGLVIVMVPVLILCGVRTILSLMKSIANTPMPNPKAWLV